MIRQCAVILLLAAGVASCGGGGGGRASPPPPPLGEPHSPVDCVGDWADVGQCSAQCGGGFIQQEFVVTTPQSGDGAACVAADGDARQSPGICNPQACLPPPKDPIIAVVDSGVNPEHFAHAPAIGETGGYFVNQEIHDAIPENTIHAGHYFLRPEIGGPFNDNGRAASQGDNAWAVPGTYPSHADKVSGTIFALRPDARLLSRRVLFDNDPASDGAGYISQGMDALRFYNRWAAENGKEQIRIINGSFGLPRDKEGDFAGYSDIYRVGELLREFPGMLGVFAAGNEPRRPSPSRPASLPSQSGYENLKTRIIAVVGARSRGGDNAQREENAVYYPYYARCGLAKEWCIAALARNVPTSIGRPFGGTSAAAPRVSATAAGVMRHSGMTDGAAVQQVIFRTAFKCHKSGSPNKIAATPFAADATLAELLNPDCGGDGYGGYAPRNADESGQGFLNYVGATVEANGIRVAAADGQGRSRLREAAFHLPEIFGDAAIRELADMELDLIAPSGNRYRHRPLAGGVESSSFFHPAAKRAFAFGAMRIAHPKNTASGARLFAHSQTPFLLREERGAMSGFSYQTMLANGAFSFSYDGEILPSRFAAQTTLLPEAHFSPYLDFARKGAELSYRQSGFSLSAASGKRGDDYGDSDATIGIASYRHQPTAGFQTEFAVGALQEKTRLLGAHTNGAFAIDGALTRFAGVRAEFSPPIDKQTKIFAAMWRGETIAAPGKAAIFRDALRIGSESYALGITKQSVWRRGDEIQFSLFHPLRAYRGKTSISPPPNRDNADSAARQNLNLAARAREYDIAVSYRRDFTAGHFAIGALYRLHPAHRKNAAPEFTAALSLAREW